MKAPYFGKLNLFWCKNCNVPLITELCGLCFENSFKVKISPPGDVYPAFKGNLQLLKDTIVDNYGQSAYEEIVKTYLLGCVLFNKVSYEDRMDQVIAKGIIIGNLRYNLERDKFEFVPSLETAKIMWSKDCKKYIKIHSDAAKFIKDGANILVPGVDSIEESVEKNETVLIISQDKVIAVASAKMTAKDIKGMIKGTAAKKKYYKDNVDIIDIKSPPGNWEKALDANKNSLKNKESEAIQFIKNVATNKEGKHLVAYSGGKDSLVVLELVDRAGIDYDMLFVDTGLEFPETIENCIKTHKHYSDLNPKIRFLTKSVDNSYFWNYFEKFGPPGRDARYCCKRSKLSPVSEILQESYPDKKEVLTFIGKRKYESLGRSKEKRVAKNQWIPKQVSGFPIINWNALDVFLYIKFRVPNLLNQLYVETPLSRIGCWLCPASNMADMITIGKSHPELSNKLNENLENYRKLHALPKEWITKGIWRWHNIPTKVRNILPNEIVLELEKNRLPPLNFQIEEYLQVGKIIKRIRFSRMLNTENLKHVINLAGKNEYDEETDSFIVTRRSNKAIISADGVVEFDDINNNFKFVEQVISTIVKSEECDGCKTCIPICPQNALKLRKDKIAVSKSCNQCGKCLNNCPLWKYQYSDNLKI